MCSDTHLHHIEYDNKSKYGVAKPLGTSFQWRTIFDW